MAFLRHLLPSALDRALNPAQRLAVANSCKQPGTGREGGPLACDTHLCLWGAPFISNQQQIALSVNHNLFLESATCHTHKKSRYARKTGRAESRQTWASLVGKYTRAVAPGAALRLQEPVPELPPTTAGF